MVRGGEVYACRITYLNHLCVVWVGGHGVPDADMISGRPRKWITSNRALATVGPGEQEEEGLLSNGSCPSSVPTDDPTGR